MHAVGDEAAVLDVRGRSLLDPGRIVQVMKMLTPPARRNLSDWLPQI